MIDHYSFSQLNTLLKCGELYRRRYVNKERIPPGGRMVRGTCAHRTVEKNFKGKLVSGEDLPIEEVVDTFVDEWEREKYGVAFSEEELAGRSPHIALGTFKDDGVRMVKKYRTEFCPTVSPAFVEEKFVIEFQEDFPKLVGIIDLGDTSDVIYDQKFVGRSPGKDEIVYDSQLTVYDYGFRIQHQKKPVSLRKVSIVNQKAEIKIVMQSAPPRDDETIWRFLNRLKKAHDTITAGNFLPAAAGVWWCSEKWCGFWKTCKVRP